MDYAQDTASPARAGQTPPPRGGKARILVFPSGEFGRLAASRLFLLYSPSGEYVGVFSSRQEAEIRCAAEGMDLEPETEDYPQMSAFLDPQPAPFIF